jgi:cell division protein ZapD
MSEMDAEQAIATEAEPSESKDSLIVYEQPVNELMRSCLRLEYLFNRIDHCLEKLSIDDSAELIVKTIIDILDLLDRPDLKSRITKEFHRHYTSFSQWVRASNVDKSALESTLKQLKRYKEHFLSSQMKIANSLRAEPFIASIRQHFNYPGDCQIDSPLYLYWLHQPAEAREKDLHNWLDHLSQIRSAITLLLKIVRDCADMQEVDTEHGFYHQTLNAEVPCQLIRVGLKTTDECYPEISAGRHRMSVRFLQADTFDPPLQSNDSISFQLACCSI